MEERRIDEEFEKTTDEDPNTGFFWANTTSVTQSSGSGTDR